MCSRIVVLVVLVNVHFSFSELNTTEYRGEGIIKEPLLQSLQNNYLTENDTLPNDVHLIKTRVKRAKGTDKFSKAAEMTETRMFQMYLQLFKNLWVSSYVGGGHPLHPDVPKPVLQMYKQRILSFFFPPIGEDAQKV